jgi:hypothetical protein
MLKMKLEYFSGLATWKIRLVLILVKHSLEHVEDTLEQPLDT